MEDEVAAVSLSSAAIMPLSLMGLMRSTYQFFQRRKDVGYYKKTDGDGGQPVVEKVYGRQDEDISKYATDFKPPTFTIKELRDAVPPHCFVRDTMRSLSYVARDLTMVAVLFYLAANIKYLPTMLQLVAWPAYWIAQGIVGTGIWILAHECGHRAFSPSRLINDIFGMILHSAVLVPFHAWRLSHSTHHKNTNHMDRDQPFVPRTRSDILHRIDEVLEEAPIWRLLKLSAMFLIGWPWYLTLNAGGPKATRGASHFDPDSVLFEPQHRHLIVLSNLGIGSMFAILGIWSYLTSPATVFFMYGIPYLMVNFWLVLITFLQHTDPYIPHYRDNEWNFVRGSLCTVDRDFGILNYFFHHITDTHVAHHLFSQMPFYHAEEATEHIRKVLGPHYRSDKNHWLSSLKFVDRRCVFVEDEGDVVFWKGR